jgi:hypothetical protein
VNPAPGGSLQEGKGPEVIDIVRDYTAICRGTTRATTNRVLGAASSSVLWASTGGNPERLGIHPEEEVGLVAAVAQAPRNLVTHVHGEVDRLVERLGLVSEAEIRSLRQQVQRLERHIGDIRGDR